MPFLSRLLRLFAVGGPDSRHVLRPRAARDVEDLGAGRFRCNGHPQLWLDSDRARAPRGWVLLRFEVLEASEYLYPTFRAMDGPGEGLLETIQLPVMGVGTVDTLICLPYGTGAIRFEPTDRACVFALGSITAREVSVARVLGRGLLRNPLGFLKALFSLPRSGYAEFRNRIVKFCQAVPDTYGIWIQRFDTRHPADEAAIRAHCARLAWKPKISVVMPVWNTPETYLRAAIESILAQLYPDWELCIADDASTKPHVNTVLREFAARDSRIKLVTHAQNGRIARASNSALALATGEFIALMDHDDTLANHALYMIAAELNTHPDADILYSDEDKMDEDGDRFDPFFKPDWDPERIYAQNYINHLGVYRTSLVRDLGGFREGFEGSQDYDLALRAVARTRADRIRHIPVVLYHWRIFPNALTFSMTQRDKATDAARRALREHFAEKGETVEIASDDIALTYRVRRPVFVPAPRVSLIVPTRDRLSLLKPCIEDLLNKTDYPDVEVIIVDNGSTEPETLAFLAAIAAHPKVRVLRIEGPFNFSALNNSAARIATGEILGFINNDIAVIAPDWLHEMVSQLTPQDVAVVGAKLYYGNDTLQHGGVVLGIGGVAGHAEKHAARKAFGYFGQLQATRSISAVTAACMLIRRKVFEEVGGFDEVNLAVAFNDVDLCLKVRAAGHRIVWTPYAALYHLESASRGADTDPAKAKRFEREVLYMLRRWGPVLEQDPYYNPNLALTSESLSYASPPRVTRPWTQT